ncbi:hypothetical protein Tco_0515228 [Tanacetum coccineum]
MESQSETTQTVSALKLPVLKTGDCDLWSMRMEQYLTHTDYESLGGPIPPKTAEQKLARKNELKAKSTLLTSPLVDDDMIEEHVVQNHDRTQNPNYDLEEVLPMVEYIKEIRDHPIDQVIGELYQRTLRIRSKEPLSPRLNEDEYSTFCENATHMMIALKEARMKSREMLLSFHHSIKMLLDIISKMNKNLEDEKIKMNDKGKEKFPNGKLTNVGLQNVYMFVACVVLYLLVASCSQERLKGNALDLWVERRGGSQSRRSSGRNNDPRGTHAKISTFYLYKDINL